MIPVLSDPIKLKDIADALSAIFRATIRPIWYRAGTNNLGVQTDTNSTILTYQYLVYPYSGYGPGTTVWGQSITDGLNMARSSWSVNVRSLIR
jgi:hypothetical protein